MEEKNLILKLKEELIYFESNFENQLKLNDKIEKIIVWIIGFVFITLGVILSNLNIICSKHFPLAFFIFSLLTVVFALLSRIYGYYFNLSYLANLNAIKRKIKNSNVKIPDDLKNEIPLLNLKAKKSTINNIEKFKKCFVRFSWLTLLSFLISFMSFIIIILTL